MLLDPPRIPLKKGDFEKILPVMLMAKLRLASPGEQKAQQHLTPPFLRGVRRGRVGEGEEYPQQAWA